MSSGIERSHGKPRVRVRRSRKTKTSTVDAASVLAGPIQDAATGRFLPGNQAARLRLLKPGPSLVTLSPEACAPWLRPYVEDAHVRARDFLVEVGGEGSATLQAYAEDAAVADGVHRALLALAADPTTDEKTRDSALKEARMWLNEKRQSVTTLRVEARAKLPTRAEQPAWMSAPLPKKEPTE